MRRRVRARFVRRGTSDAGFLLVGILALGTAALLLLLGRGFLGGFGARPSAEPRRPEPRAELWSEERATIDLFERASPSVAHISTARIASRPTIFGVERFRVAEGTGSGFLWDAQGHVVTNFHVIREATSATVRLSDRSSWSARLVGTAPDYDLAVLRIDAPRSRLRPIAIGTSRDLRVGQRVFAIGNPFGLDQTLTTGVISGLDREILSQTNRTILGVVQTDAAINPGNSGGPLLDSSGRLIGVNTAIATTSGTYAGVGFAVPVDTVNRVVPDLIRVGRVERPVMGVTIRDALARSMGIEGVAVVDVVPDGPADRAGMRGISGGHGELELGDVIVGVGERRIRDSGDLFAALEAHRPGDEVAVRALRGGKEERTFRIRLERAEGR